VSDKSYNWRKTHEKYIPSEIDRMVTDLDLNESTANMAKQVHQMTLNIDYEPSSSDMLAPACVFAATRLQGQGVRIGEVANVARVEEKAIRTTYRSISRKLDLSIEPDNAEPFVQRYTRALDFPEESYKRALRLTRDATDHEISSKMSPQTLASCVVYLVGIADDLHVTQVNISEAGGASPFSIRKYYRRIADALEINLYPRRGMDVTERREPPETVTDATDRLKEVFDPPPEFWGMHTDVLNRRESTESPACVAGAFWVASQEGDFDVSQADLAYHMGISRASLQNYARKYRGDHAE